MMNGIYNDNFNSISVYDVYALQADYPVDIGKPDSLATQTAPNNDTPSTGVTNAGTVKTPGSPAHWWLVFVVIFAVFVFVARKFAGDDRYSNIRASVYNMFFLTFFIILIMNVMKRIAAAVPPNPVSALVLAA